MAKNDLIDFLNSASNQIDEEYFRIQKRAKEDPGTAGDQGEENWAKLLKDWLPPIFQIVTKGRIINSEGDASPQIDIIVLKPEYPKGLLDKKLYLAGGVLAAFECKTTLKAKDLEKFFRNSIVIKKLLPQGNSIYDKLQSPIFYGLLAHSHIWKKGTGIIEKISDRIWQFDLNIISHPIQVPDLICIANLGAWHAIKSPLPHSNYVAGQIKQVIITAYMCEQTDKKHDVKAIGSAIKWLLFKLSKEHTGLESLSKYFKRTLRTGGSGPLRYWPIKEVFSEMHLKELKKIQNDQSYNFPDNWKYLALT